MSLAPETPSEVGFSEAAAAPGGTDTETDLETLHNEADNEPEVDCQLPLDASSEVKPEESKESEEEVPKEKDPPPSPKSRPPRAPTTSTAKKLMKPVRPFGGTRLYPNMRITHSVSSDTSF